MIAAFLTSAVLARISLCGKGIELLGGCYLAYDLLDGRHGPLRSIARATGYLPLFLCGYTLLLGVPFALAASAGMAVLLAVEFQVAAAPPEPADKLPVKPRVKTSRRKGQAPAPRPAQAKTDRLILLLGFLRGLMFGTASVTLFGPIFGVIFGGLAGLGLVLGNAIGLAPSDDYETKTTPRFRLHNILASAYRAAVVATAATVTGEGLGVRDALWWALRLGLTAGIVSTLVGAFSPLIERWILHAPQRRLGLIGLALLLFGTLVDAAPDIATALHVTT